MRGLAAVPLPWIVWACALPQGDPAVARKLPAACVEVADLPAAELALGPGGGSEAGWRLGSVRRDGVEVEAVRPGGPAAEAGLLPGDRLAKIGAFAITGRAELEAALAALSGRRQLVLQVHRPGGRFEVLLGTAGRAPGLELKRRGGRLRVVRVEPKGPAARAGLAPGDLILRAGGAPPPSAHSLLRRIRGARPVRLRVLRRPRRFETRLVPRPAAAKPKQRPKWNGRTFKLAVVLVAFADRGPDPGLEAGAIARMLFSVASYERAPDGRRVFGSLRDFYLENSCRRFDVTGRVFDWIRLPRPWAYYDALDMGPGDGKKSTLFSDALGALAAREGAGALAGFDGLAFLYAGPRESPRGSQLWPHRGILRVGERRLPYYIVETGGGRTAPIGVHCHEFGHMLGLPDFYGYGHRTGLGRFCTMAIGHLGGGRSGPDRPFHLCAYCKARLGWLEPRRAPRRARAAVLLPPIEGSTKNALFVPVDPGRGEGFLLEVRARVGFDRDFPRPGLLIWHLGEPGQAARGQIGVPIDLEEAHAKRYFDASLREEPDCLFPNRRTRDFTPFTFPSSRSRSPGARPVWITGIRIFRPLVKDPLGPPPGSVLFWLGAPDRAAFGIPREPPQPHYPTDRPVVAIDPVTGRAVPFRLGPDGVALPGPAILPRPRKPAAGKAGGDKHRRPAARFSGG